MVAAAENGSSLTPVGAVLMGTADYLAPEQAMDFHRADIRADIYSLGCTFLYLLTGRPRFPGGNLAQKVAQHLHKEPPALESFRPDVPPEVAGVLRRKLAKRPEDRPQTPGEVARPLEPFTGPDAVTATPAGNRQWLRRWRGWFARRRMGRRITLATGLAASRVLGLLAWFLVRDAERPTAAAPTAPTAPREVLLSDRAEATEVLRGNAKERKWVKFRDPAPEVKWLKFLERAPEVPFVKYGVANDSQGLCMVPAAREDAKVRFQLSQRYREFKGRISLDNTAPDPPGVTFRVYGDDRRDPLWSGVVSKRGFEEEFSTAVSGAEVLELTVSCPGFPVSSDGRIRILPVWLKPRLVE